MKQELKTDFQSGSKALLDSLTSFSHEDFNKLPFEGSWTAGQVAEHLFKSLSGIPGLLRGRTMPSNRNSFEKTDAIREIFLDFTTRMESPEFILPTDIPKDPGVLIKSFEGVFKDLEQLMQDADLTMICLDFPFPGLGEFTGWEWICFAACHTKRHTRQINNIAQRLKSLSAPLT